VHYCDLIYNSIMVSLSLSLSLPLSLTLNSPQLLPALRLDVVRQRPKRVLQRT
jgi:hypothetical protein